MGLSSKYQVADSDYLLMRAVTEAKLAERASAFGPAKIHRNLAGAYLDRVFTNSPPADGAAKESKGERLEVARAIFSQFSRFIEPQVQRPVDHHARAIDELS